MSKRIAHYDKCPAQDDPGAGCVCEVLDEQELIQETRMTLADMIRAAKDAGHLKPGVQQYPKTA